MKKNKKDIHNNSILEHNERCRLYGGYDKEQPHNSDKYFYYDRYREHSEMPYEYGLERVRIPSYFHRESPDYRSYYSHHENPGYRSYYSHCEKRKRNPLKIISIIVWISILLVFAGLSIWNSVAEVNARSHDIPETIYINEDALTRDEHGNPITIVDDIFIENE